MKALRVYFDTSVFGGCHDAEFAQESRRLMRAVHEGKLRILVSELVLGELQDAPQEVRNLVLGVPKDNLERVELTDDVYDLQEAYLAAGILGPHQANDALHVAAATVSRADAIVSWNFRHIVRLDKIKAYNRVNFELGYGILTILSPREVITDEYETE